MLLTALKIAAGIAALGVVTVVMVAVISGLASSFAALRRFRKDDHVD